MDDTALTLADLRKFVADTADYPADTPLLGSYERRVSVAITALIVADTSATQQYLGFNVEEVEEGS